MHTHNHKVHFVYKVDTLSCTPIGLHPSSFRLLFGSRLPRTAIEGTSASSSSSPLSASQIVSPITGDSWNTTLKCLHAMLCIFRLLDDDSEQHSWLLHLRYYFTFLAAGYLKPRSIWLLRRSASKILINVVETRLKDARLL